MPPFRPLTDVQLAALDDDALIAHIRAARAAGDRAAATLAVRVLVFGYLGIVRARVALKVPREDVAFVAGTAFESAFKSAFRGESVGEFRSWLNTIVDRCVADYHRAREHRPGVVPLAEELEEGEGLGARLAVAPEQDAIDARSAVEQALAELSPRHRRTVELSVWDPRSPGARDVAREVSVAFPGDEPMTENNVHQVLSRWRKRLRVLLRGDNGAA